MKIINLGILAHVDAGKTTLTESLLYTSGAIAEPGSVDKGTTRTDTMNLERQRGITIQTAVTSFQWEDVKVNIIDTPGHMDFLAEVYRSLSVLDGAVLLVSAKDGIQAQTRILFHALQTMKIPTIFFINKIDQEGIDLPMVYREMKAKLSSEIIVKQKVGQEIKIYYKFIGFVDELHIIPTKRWAAMPAKNCTVCGVEYVPGSGASRYCPACAKKIRREKSNESKRRSREQKRIACMNCPQKMTD